MKEENNVKRAKSLRGKILYLCLGIVMVAIFVFAAIGIAQLRMLLRVFSESSESQNRVIKEESNELLWEILSSDVLGTIYMAAEDTDGEFWTMEHDYNVLGKQVADIFLHPDQYMEATLEPPLKENSGEYVPQLLFAQWADQKDEKNLIMARKLTNLAPMMEEIIRGNSRFTTDCYIALPCGITIALDNTSEAKLNDDGSAKYYDATERAWYQGAVSTGKVFFSDVVRSYFNDTTGMGFGVPVFADGELVAVLHGFTKVETLQETVSMVTYIGADYTILVSDEGQLIYSPNTTGELAMDDNLSKDIRQTSNQELKDLVEEALSSDDGSRSVTVDGTEYYAYYAKIYTLGWTQIMFMQKDQLDDVPQQLLDRMDEERDKVYLSYAARFVSAASGILIAMVALIIGAAVLAVVFSKRLVTPVNTMTKRVKAMTGDDISFEMEKIYETGDEIEVLAGSFSALTEKLKRYIKEVTEMSAEKERIGTEMATAKKIQSSMLPSKFPAFPERDEFDLYADMIPAKEVGGDLYDFYFIDDDHLVLVIGDVSGKGISASLFMVMAKHVIKSEILIHGGDVEAALESINSILMEDNAAKMFITLWIGVLTVSTGHMVYVNAGHEYPMICKKGGEFELFKDNHGAPVACKKKIKVKLNELELEMGDMLYLYTDGITEATNNNMEMFGHDRLLNVLNENREAGLKELDEAVRRAAAEFVGDAEQFDDMTTLCFRYEK